MNDTPLFSETQRFKAIWLVLIALFINGIPLYGIYVQIIMKHPFGTKPMSDNGLIIFAISLFIITLLFLSIKLETAIKADGIYYRFFPFHLKTRRKTWDEVSKAYVRQYKPLGEFGGWGIRYGGKKRGLCLNISGNKGIQFVMNNDKRLLFGTKKMEEAEKVLKQLGKYTAE